MPSAGGMRRDLGRGFRHQHDLYQISYALWCWKQRVEGKRKERDEKRKEGFAHQWSFFSSVRTQVGRLLCEVIGMFYVASCGREEPLVSRVRTQLMCGEDTTVSSLPNYRLCISSQTPSVVPISLFFSILKIPFLPRSRLKSLEVEVPLRGSSKIHRCDDKRTRWERTLTTEQLTSSSKENKEGQVLWKIQPTNYMQTKNVVSREGEGSEN